jgi:hypothetical protein
MKRHLWALAFELDPSSTMTAHDRSTGVRTPNDDRKRPPPIINLPLVGGGANAWAVTDLLATLAGCAKARSVGVHDRRKAVYEGLR